MKAWELLSKEGSWTQGVYARESDGSPCIADSHEAACFCTIGAVRRCHPEPSERLKILGTLENAVRERGALGIASWNDHPARKQDEVVALLKELDI